VDNKFFTKNKEHLFT